MSERNVRDVLQRLNIDWKTTGLDAIRKAYVEDLRSKAAGHSSGDGIDLVYERAMTERIDREIKVLQLGKLQGALVPLDEVQPALDRMLASFKSELKAFDAKLRNKLKALYGVDVDIRILNEHTDSALTKLANYAPDFDDGDPEGMSQDAEAGIEDIDK